jgi:acetyl esterase/lipase
MRPVSRVIAILFAVVAVAAGWRSEAQQKPVPSQANVRYGPHARNVLDLWQAATDGPAPLLVHIHGGGFLAGDKAGVSGQLLNQCLRSGISVASINYRYSSQAPFPAPFLDSARAIQFLRAHAAEWKLDAGRVAATGGSAGAGMSLWLAFHPDLADPKSTDPVLRQSTRLKCAAVLGAQTSYDPRVIRKVVGGRAHEHPALLPLYGLQPDEVDSPRAHAMYEKASPVRFATADDPPVFLFYNEPKGPLPADARPGQGIHHPNFGSFLKERLDELKVPCEVRHLDDYAAKRQGVEALPREMVEFFKRYLLPK